MTVANAARAFALLIATTATAGGQTPPQPPPLPDTVAPPPPKPDAAERQAAPLAEGALPSDEGTLPADKAACRGRLRALGVSFTEAPAIDEPEGCEAAHPLTVSQLPGDVALLPDATLTCVMAEATARFVKDRAAPLAQQAFASPLAAVEQASSYVCRGRRDAQKLSEHAFANALDWSALVLEDGTRVEVRAHDPAREPRAFLLISALHKAACGPFATVLGPGSDADHADHFHFDMATRRNPFCQ